jgi:hypothetical protein
MSRVHTSLLQSALLSILLLLPTQTGTAAGAVDEVSLRNAWALYTQQKYAAAADAFEALIRKSAPNARLYYYAAAANKGSNRVARAKQLCQYVIANFPNSAEAGSAQKLFQDAAPAASVSGAADALPASLNGKTLDELMQTEEGRQTLKEALNKQKSAPVVSAAVTPPRVHEKSRVVKDNDHPFGRESITEYGADGITQFSPSYPDCWFECSMVALSMLPRGQELLTQMIRSPEKDGTCLVRFPGDGVEYIITPKKLDESRVRDKALWASLIHCAQVMKFGHNSGGIEEGLSCLTGKKAEKIFSANTTEQALITFVGEAVKLQHPIVCLAADDFGTMPELAESGQAYTITGYDPATKMITMRNPHSDNSRRFRLKTDPEHQKFEQLNDGVFKMHVSLFPQYFSQVARASI